MARHRQVLWALALAFAAALLSACGDCLFLYPLYSANNTVTDKALEGSWAGQDAADDFYVKIEPSGEGGYLLETGHGAVAESRYSARLIELGAVRYLDLYPVGADGLDQGALFGRGFIAFHRLYQIEQIEPVLIARELDGAWLERALQFEPDAIRHEHVKPEESGAYHLVLAKQALLESFIARHSISDRNYWKSRKGEGDLVLIRAGR